MVILVYLGCYICFMGIDFNRINDLEGKCRLFVGFSLEFLCVFL